MQSGYVLKKDMIAIAKTGSGFSEPLILEAGTIVPSYGLSNGGIVEWKEFHQRAGLIENAKRDGTFNPVITSSGTESCPKDGEWEIFGTEVKVSLTQGDTFPSQYKNYIWILRKNLVKKDEEAKEDGTSN